MIKIYLNAFGQISGESADALLEYAKKLEQDVTLLAQRVFDTELMTDQEVEIVARYLPRDLLVEAGYLKK